MELEDINYLKNKVLNLKQLVGDSFCDKSNFVVCFFLKVIVYPRNNSETVLTLHPSCRLICFWISQNLDEFLFWMWRNLVLHLLLNNGSSALNGCHQNESPNSWQKHHNNPKQIHMTPVHQLTSCEAKNKEITAFESSVQNTAFSSEKCI